MKIFKLPDLFCTSVENQLAERGDPPPGPHPTKLINELLKVHLAPFMKGAGFRKSGAYFWRESGLVIDVLDLQKSQWNNAWEASFYINLHVYWKDFQEAIGRPFKSKFPKGHECTLFTRVIKLDKSTWSLKPDSNVETLASLLIQEIQKEGFPWFEEHHHGEATLRQLRELNLTKFADDFECYLREQSCTPEEQ
jgi:hypothetical protein